jgi:hypothetical protein
MRRHVNDVRATSVISLLVRVQVAWIDDSNGCSQGRIIYHHNGKSRYFNYLNVVLPPDFWLGLCSG